MSEKGHALIDLLLLSAPDDDPWAPRTRDGIAADVAARLEADIVFAGMDITRFAPEHWLTISANGDGEELLAPTLDGAMEHFQQRYGVSHFLRRDRPFGGGVIEALAHWFDDHFSPGTQMSARLSETGIPRAWLKQGTKWREAATVFGMWNRLDRYSYFSAFLVYILHPEQWVGRGDLRSGATGEISAMFGAAGLELHEDRYLVPLIGQKPAAAASSDWDDEGHFRDNIIEPLLKRMPHILSVTQTHGSGEFGRDFLFDYNNELLGDRRWTGVQTKAGNVSGEAGGQLRTIIDQIHMAFEHPVVDLATLGTVAMSEMIVAISGRFTKNAEERILDSIRDPVWRANTSFLDRPRIEGLMKRFGMG